MIGKPANGSSGLNPPGFLRARTRRAVWLLCAAFGLRGFFLNLALPYGDPLDEIFHFGYAVFFETTGHPPDHPATFAEAQYLKCIYLKT